MTERALKEGVRVEIVLGTMLACGLVDGREHELGLQRRVRTPSSRRAWDGYTGRRDIALGWRRRGELELIVQIGYARHGGP